MGREDKDSKTIILVSTADWDNPYWTNKQHVALELANLGYKVFYIESQGLRAPTATVKDAKRILGKLKKGIRPPRKVHEGIFVWCPLTIPFQRFAFVRALNRSLLGAGIAFWGMVLGIKSPLLWTYSPMTTALYSINKYRLVVYHCVDDITAQPGMPAAVIRHFEDDLVAKSDVVFVTAPSLLDYHKKNNPNTFYHSNVADFRHFNRAITGPVVTPPDIKEMPGKKVGFIGAISNYKIDFDLIEFAARSLPDVRFILIGEVGEGQPGTDASNLLAVPNIIMLGGKKYSSLPDYLSSIDVAILPNRINAYTKAMFPMKFFEYLAAGKPVVSTALESLREFEKIADICESKEEFVRCIKQRIDDPNTGVAERIAMAKSYTYEARTQKMLKIVNEAIERKKSE